MEHLLARYARLSVGLIPPISIDTESNSSVQMITKELIEHYKRFRIYSKFGSKNVKYICDLASRYAHSTLQTEDRGAMKAYSLWLSLVWLIDGFFDKCKSEASQDHIDSLIRIFNLEYTHNISDHAILEVSFSTYSIYLDFITPYCMGNLGTFSKLTEWLIKYLRTLIIPSKSSHKKSKSHGSQRAYHKIYSVPDYTRWRLDSGAMMCIIWHLMLFNSLSPDGCFLRMFKLAALVVSFHNDILSYNRDLRQQTPNLISSIKEEYNISDFDAMLKAIQVTDRLYSDIATEFLRLQADQVRKEYIGSLILDILEGTYSWEYSEPRYEIGIKMLKALEESNRKAFYSLLFDNGKTPGDPK